MGNSGCMKYRKWNHTLELFGNLHAFTHVHTERIWHNNVRWSSRKKTQQRWLFFCSKL